MPAQSKAQQKAAGMALAVRRGEEKKSSLKGAAKEMYESMSEAALERMASAKRRDLPPRAGKD